MLDNLGKATISRAMQRRFTVVVDRIQLSATVMQERNRSAHFGGFASVFSSNKNPYAGSGQQRRAAVDIRNGDIATEFPQQVQQRQIGGRSGQQQRCRAACIQTRVATTASL